MPTQPTAPSAKAYLEHLGTLLSRNAMELHEALLTANRARDKQHRVHTSTIRSHFFEDHRPGKDVLALVRQAVARLTTTNSAAAWREDRHSYEAFCRDRPPIQAPMTLNVAGELSAPAPGYVGDFAVVRKRSDGTDETVVVDILRLLRTAHPRVLEAEWRIREELAQRDVHHVYRGHAYLARTAIQVTAARDDDGDIAFATLLIARNRNDDAARMVASAQGCCSIDEAPVSKGVYIVRLSDRLGSEDDMNRAATAIQESIHAQGRGAMTFNEFHARPGDIANIPLHVLDAARNWRRRPASAAPQQAPPAKGKRRA